MEVLVVGAGTMGRWVAGCASDADFAVTFADSDPAAATEAAETVGAETAPLDAAGGYDAVCLAVPMSVIEEAIAEQAHRADRAILDVSGVMRPALAAMREHAPDRERVSLHPLFAPSNEPGNVAVVADEPGPVTDDLRAAIAARGNDSFETTAAEHDEAMETVQSRAHTAVLSFALAAQEVPEEFHTPISEPLTELAEQVTGGTPSVYSEIQETFEGADDVAEAAARIADASPQEFERLYREAGER